MVLVTPQQASRRPRADVPAGPGQRAFDDATAAVAATVAAAAATADPPSVSPDEVLALLRDGSGRRPRFDPGLAGGLRAWLEDGAAGLSASRGDSAPPLFLGMRLLWGDPVASSDPAEGAAAEGAAAEPYPTDLVRSCLVHALFRQMVTTGRVEDPLGDALGALRVDPGRHDMVRHIDGLTPADRTALATSLRLHVENLERLTPRFAAGWLPRTGDRVAIPLAGGRVVLCGMFDLLVGAPVPGRASLCAVGLTTGGRWAHARTALHYLALLETLRSGTPPFRVALLHSAAGRFGVEDLLEEHLRAIVSHVVARLTALGRGNG